MKIKIQIKKNYNLFPSLSNESRAPVLRSLALVGSLPAPGLIRGPPRDLDPVGSTRYDGYYSTKGIIAGRDCFTKETTARISGSKNQA